tara:strand:+ start:2046 stop:2996 length:951 start_codon:yes stop_codon:yes gene_type:complete
MNHHENEGFINLGDVLSVLLNYKKIILLSILLSALVSVFVAKSTPNIYRSSALLEPQQENQTQNSFSSSGMSSLAAVAGIQLPSASGDRGLYAIETIKSKLFFKHLLQIDSEIILPSLMAIDSYNIVTNTITYDKKIYDQKSQKWIRSVKGNQKKVPSYIEAHDYFLSILEIFKDKKTGYVYIAIDHQSPVFAEYILKLIISEVNTISREKEIKESSDAIDYLSLKQYSTNVTSLKSSINKLIEQQLQKQMISNIKEEFLLKTIDPPIIPEVRVRPNRVFICIIGVFFGFILSVFSILVYSLVTKNFFKQNLTRSS